MKIETGTKQNGLKGRLVRGGVLLVLLTTLLCSIAILSFGSKIVAGAADITYDYKIENSTGTSLKVTAKDGTVIGTYTKLPDAVDAIIGPNNGAAIQLGDGTSPLKVSVDKHFSCAVASANEYPILYGMNILNGKSVTLLGNMEVAGADINTTQTATGHPIAPAVAQGGGNDWRYATCIEVGTRDGGNGTASVTLKDCNITMIAPQAIGPMPASKPDDETYRQSVVLNHGGNVTVTGGSYSALVSDHVRNVIMPIETTVARKGVIDNLAIFSSFVSTLNGKYIINGGEYLTDANAFAFYVPAAIDGITLTTTNGSAIVFDLAQKATLKNSTINCTGEYNSHKTGTNSIIQVNNVYDKNITFYAEKVTIKVSDTATYFPVGLRTMGKSVLKDCRFEMKGLPAVLQLDKSVDATNCTFISDNDGSLPAGSLHAQHKITEGTTSISYTDVNTISNAYGAFCIATPQTDPAVYYTKFHGKNLVKNTSVSATAYGIASAKLEPTTKIVDSAYWSNAHWGDFSVTWEKTFSKPLVTKTVNYNTTELSLKPYILRTKACANIFLGDNVNIESKAENIYCTDLAGFKIHTEPSYNTHTDNKIVTLKFDEVGENNVAVWGTTNAQMFRLVSNTHSLRVGTGVNANNLVMFAGVTLNVFSATVKGGYVYATCGFWDNRVTKYEVWIGTKVNADETLDNEKKMEPAQPDELGQFIAKIKLESGDKGKRVIQLRYYSVGDKRSTATLLITILKTDDDKNLTGEMDFGELEAGDKLEYKTTNGKWENFNGTIPDDAFINSENQIELKYTPAGGESFVFNAEAAPREEVAAGVDPLTGKISKTNNSVTVETTEGFEYRLKDKDGNVIPNCSWTAGAGGKVVFSGLASGTEYIVEAHKKGTASTLPSKSVSENATTLTDAQQIIEDAKAAARNELDAVATAEKAKVDSMTGLTQDEKDDIKASIDSAATDGKTAIDSKTTVADIDSAKVTATGKIEQATTDAAKKIVKDYAGEVKTLIDNSGLTQTEKNAAKAEVDKKVTAANNAIDDAIDVGSINTAITDGKDGILNDYKEVAKKELDATATAEKAKIDSMTGLAQKEKDELKAAIDSAVIAVKADIDAKTTVADVKSAKDTANAAIEKLTTDAAKKIVKGYADEVKASIDDSSLTLQEKAAAKAEVDKKVTAANNAIDTAIDVGSINTAITDGKNGMLEEYKKVAKKDLENYIAGIGDHQIEGIIDTAKTGITGATEKGDIDELVAAAKKASLDKYKEDAKAAVDTIYNGLKNKGELTQELEAAKAQIDNADYFGSVDSAKEEGILKLQKEDAKARLDKYIGGVNESQSLKVISDAKTAIDNATTNSEIGAIADKAEADSFDKYKSAKIKELTDYYNSLSGSGKYNTAGLAELAAIYKNDTEGAWNILNGLTKDDGFKKVDEKLEEGIDRFKAVKVSSVGSGGLETGSGSDFEYPDDKKDGELAGKIESSEGMSSNIELQINKDTADNKNKVESAIKNGNIKGADGNSLSAKEAANLLKDKELKATFDIKLVYNNNGQITVVPNGELNGRYTIQILLPQNMRHIQSLQIIFIDDNGNVEVFETQRVGNYIVFTTTHFSSYLILGEPEINLWWLIILLIIIIVLEIAFILLWHLVFSKKLDGNKNESSKDDTDSKGSSQKNKAVKTYSFAPVALLGTVIVPSGGIIAIIILAIAALGLGAYIVYMLIKSLKKTEKSKATEEVTEESICVEKESIATLTPAVPLTIFSLSRQDVLERIESMAADKEKFPILPFTKERLSARNCDSFRCGEFWSFGVMFESKAEILKFMLRLDKDYAQELELTHPGITATEFGGGKEWYKIIIDDTFTSKKQVFAILDEAYCYVLKTRYTFDEDKKTFVTDETIAKKEEETFAEVLKVAEKEDDELIAAEATAEKRNVLIFAQLTFKPSKKEIAEKMKNLLGEGAHIAERENATKTGLPLADTYYSLEGISDAGIKKKVCFTYVYQLKSNGIKVIVKISKALAESLMEMHPSLCRSKFPKGKDWYVFNVDGSFPSMESLTSLITAAKDFVNSEREAQ